MLVPSVTLFERLARSLPRSFGDRLALARRDLRMVLDGVAGRVPPPVIRAHEVARVTPAIGTRKARVVSIHRETPDAVSVVLEDLAGARFEYLPGQFFTLCAAVDGAHLRRAYSASRPPSPDGTLRITVKRVADGVVSTWVTTRLAEGDVVELLGPSGSFVVADPAAAQHLVLIGGGSGVTPLYAIAASVLAAPGDARVTMLYGNRAEPDVIFAGELSALASRHGDRFMLLLALQSPHEGFEGLAGVLDEAAVTSALDRIEERELPRVYYLCGPTPMREAARRALVALSVDPARIHEEVYASPHRALDSDARDALITLRIKGRARELKVQAGETILDAALREGIDMPYSCAMGGCGACRCERLSGEVVMESPNCLTDEERAAGSVLTCVGRPEGPGVVLEVP